jgi:N-methylhydantoinase A
MQELADSLEMTVLDLAHSIVEIANENMANAIRMVSIERGHDPRHFALLAFGGAGPLHGAAIAGKLGIPRMVVPPFPGSFSALGLLLGDLRVDKVWTQGYRSDRATAADVVGRFDTIAAAATSELRAQGFDGTPSLEYAINMRYLGQNYETEVEVPPLSLDMLDTTPEEQLARAYRAFNDAHREMYDYVIKGAVIEMTSFRVTAIGAIPHPQLARITAEEPDRGRSRGVYFAGHGRVETTLMRRPRMPIEQVIAGPVIIEEAGSTTLIEPGMTVRRTDQDILIVEVN